MRSVGDEPACCGHARRLGERPIFGDPWPFGPASTGPGQTPPLGRASPRGSLSGGSSGVDAKIRSASSLNLFPTIKKRKKERKKEAGNLFLAGPMVPQRPSQASGGTEDTHQIGAGCRENLQVVCMWPKQESALL